MKGLCDSVFYGVNHIFILSDANLCTHTATWTHTHIEESGGEREVGREVRGRGGERQRAQKGHRVPS